jgi:RNA polymerase sigma-70 factor
VRHLSDALVTRLYRQAKGERWALPHDAFADALNRAAARAFAARDPSARELEQYLGSLHLEDLALASACAAGSEPAWDHFIQQYRGPLYRAADAIDATGSARELADALYGDLYGARERDGERQSLFRYFHGRSSLATWLRAVLAQRHVDGIRTKRRFEPLPEDAETIPANTNGSTEPDPERARYLQVMEQALSHAVDVLPPRDRLRLASYYTQQLTLAQTGRLLGEHEATVSRQLARTRTTIKVAVEEYLRNQGFTADEAARCFECVLEDAGSLDLSRIVRKDSAARRSI